MSLNREKTKRRTLFLPPKSTRAADLIDISSVLDARESIGHVKDEFEHARRLYVRTGWIRYKKMMVSRIRWAVLATNRARAQLQRKNLTARERHEMNEVADLWADLSKDMVQSRKTAMEKVVERDVKS